jgi:hypothetical protein
MYNESARLYRSARVLRLLLGLAREPALLLVRQLLLAHLAAFACQPRCRAAASVA